MLTLPASSAEVERGFSQLKILKSYIHSTLSEERLNDLLAVKLLSADIQNFDPLPAIELWSTSTVRTSQRECSTAVVNVAADNTIVPTASSVAVPVAGTAAESDSNAASVVLDPEKAPSAPVAHSTEASPQSNSGEALPSAVILPVNEDPHPLDAEIIGCTDDDEERDSGVDDDSDLQEEFIDRLIQKYL